jgi:putative transposase
MFKHPRLLPDFDYIGKRYYSLTWNCENREPLFTQKDRVDLVCEQILRACRETEIEVIAYCFMPDHLHQLIHGCTPVADGRWFVKRAKQYSGFYFAAAFEKRLWQRYGRDQVLREDDDARPIAQYIIENPVRAGLVARGRDYAFTGSQVYTIDGLIDWAYSLTS